MRGLAVGLLAALFAGMSFIKPAVAQPAAKTALTVDLPNDVATMDPQLQWDTESYSVYRNIFDNLVTRDTAGKIVPQVATAWHYADPRTIVFDLRVRYHVPGRQQADAGRCGVQRAPHHQSRFQEPAAVAVRPDHVGRGDRARRR